MIARQSLHRAMWVTRVSRTMYIWCRDMCAATARAAAAAQDDLLAAHKMAAKAGRLNFGHRERRELHDLPIMTQHSSRELQLFLVQCTCI